MANHIDNLINFLRLSRRREEAEKNANTNNTTNATVIDTDESLFIDNVTFEDENKYKRIYGILDNQAATDIYIFNGINEKKYYIKTKEIHPDGFNYINLENYQSEQVIENTLASIRIYFEYSNYFFDTINKRVIIAAKTLETAYVYNDIIVYDPEKIEIETGKYAYEFDNPTSTFDTITKPIPDSSGLELLKSFFAVVSNVMDRIVTLNKSNRLGAIHLIPNIGKNDGNYFVEYVYIKNGKKLFFEKSTELTALYLEFKCEGTFINFLNETILLDPDFDYTDCNRNERRSNFIDAFHDLVIVPLEKNIASNSEMYFYDAMKTIHYLGNQVLLTLSTITFWKLFETTIARNSLTNKREVKEEDIFVKLVDIISQKEPKKDVFLEKLLEKVQKTKLTYLEFLYDRITGDNFVKFTKIIFEAWKKSSFIIPTDEIYPKQNTFGPLFLPYESEKILGFYFSNAKVSFESNNIVVDIATEKHKEAERIGTFGEVYKEEVPVHENYIYSPFYPIAIKDLESQETEIKFEKVIPAFFLKVNGDKEFWHNVIKGAEYAADVAITISGVGNLAKFRYLASLGETGSAVAKIRLVAGVVEVSSGVTNTLLKLTGFEDTESGKALQQYLFWLELLSLSGEVGLGVKNIITKNLQKSANELVGSAENAAKFEKELDEALIKEGNAERKLTDAEKGEVLEHLDEVTELDLMAQPAEIGKYGGKKLTASQIRKYKGGLKHNGVETFFEEDLMLNKAGKKIKNKETVNKFIPFTNEGIKFDTAQDFYIYMKQKGILGGFHAKTKQLFLTEKPTEYLAFHEKMHVKHFLEIGDKYHDLQSWEKETYVFLELWKQKHLWTKEELQHALDYVNGSRKQANQKLLNYKI